MGNGERVCCNPHPPAHTQANAPMLVLTVAKNMQRRLSIGLLVSQWGGPNENLAELGIATIFIQTTVSFHMHVNGHFVVHVQRKAKLLK